MSGDIALRWTLDVFNPRNEECRLGCYDWNCEYLELSVVDFSRPSYNASRQSIDSFLPRQHVLNELISKAHIAVGSVFTFGSSYDQVRYFAEAFHFSRGKVPKWLDFPNVVWQWAIYPLALQKKQKLDPQAVAVYQPQAPHSPMEALFVETLPDSSALVYSILTHEFECGRYAKAMGLKSLDDIKLKDVPLE